MSRDIMIHSHAGIQRQQAISATEIGERVKVLIDQERTYAVEKSLFAATVYGGYTSIELEDEEVDCGVNHMEIPYLGTKTIPYWRYDGELCMPDEDRILNIFNINLELFSRLDRSVLDAIRFWTSDFDLNIYFKNYCDSNFKERLFSDGIIEIRWADPNNDLYVRIPHNAPSVEYRTDIYSHLILETNFHKLYETSKNFVDVPDSQELHFLGLVNNPRQSPVRNIIDKDNIVVTQTPDGTIYSCKCTGDKYDSSGDGNANQPLKNWQTCEEEAYCFNVESPFRTLAEFYECCPGGGCNELSVEYNKECTIHAERNVTTGELDIISFSGYCETETETKDTIAIKCILNSTISEINRRYNSRIMIIAREDEIKNIYEFFELNLTYKGGEHTESKYYIDSEYDVVDCDDSCGDYSQPCCYHLDGYYCDAGHHCCLTEVTEDASMYRCYKVGTSCPK